MLQDVTKVAADVGHNTTPTAADVAKVVVLVVAHQRRCPSAGRNQGARVNCSRMQRSWSRLLQQNIDDGCVFCCWTQTWCSITLSASIHRGRIVKVITLSYASRSQGHCVGWAAAQRNQGGHIVCMKVVASRCRTRLPWLRWLLQTQPMCSCGCSRSRRL